MIRTENEVDFILRRLDSWVERGLARRAVRRRPGPVRELHIELTHRCNQRCVMCHHWLMPRQDRGGMRRELGLDEIRRLVEGSSLLDGVESVVLTGGEPWLRADSVDILDVLARRFPQARVGILSNLWDADLVRRRLAEARGKGLARLWIGSSLDGLGPVHDEVRGRAGAFRRLMAAIAMVRAESPGTELSLNFTITPRNHRQLWAAYQHAKGLGLWFGAQMTVNHEGLRAPEIAAWKAAELARVAEQIDGILLDLCRGEGAAQRLLEGRERESLWLWTRLLYWARLKRFALRPERFFRDCLAGERFVMLDPEGRLFFCPVNKHRQIGGVRESPLDELWASPRARAERRHIASGRCACWLNCIAVPVLDRVLAAGL
ncbi:MAG: radical SAM protein [Elusimicrobia bacterium]|nr:radical SAM protein [Elusimicrobiota bacterium]